MKKFLLFGFLALCISGCVVVKKPFAETSGFQYASNLDYPPVSFHTISDQKMVDKNDFILSSFGSGFFDNEKSSLQVSGKVQTYEDVFAHLTIQAISFRSHRPNQAPFTMVDGSFNPMTTIIENISRVQEIPSNTGMSAFLFTFEKVEQNPLSGSSLSENQDPHLALYYRGKLSPVLNDFWLGELAYPKVWSGSLWHLELNQEASKIPEYLVMKDQEKIGSFFSLPGAQSLVKSFQVDDRGWRVAYQKTTKLAGKDDFKREPAFELNGEDLLLKNGWEEVLGLNKVGNQIFFFFKTQEGKIGYYWRNALYPTDFDEIEDAGCCGVPNILFTEGKMRFMAKKQGFWQEYEGIFDKDLERRERFQQSAYYPDPLAKAEFENLLPVNFEGWHLPLVPTGYRSLFSDPIIVLASGWNAYLKKGFAQFGEVISLRLPEKFDCFENLSYRDEELPNRIALSAIDDQGRTKNLQFFERTSSYSPCLQSEEYRKNFASERPDSFSTGTIATAMGELPYQKTIYSIYDEEGILPTRKSERRSVCIQKGATEYILDLYNFNQEERNLIFDSLKGVE